MQETAEPLVPPRPSLGTRTVFGEGRRSARLMLVGEQPGDVEDREGRPFVGPAGLPVTATLHPSAVLRGPPGRREDLFRGLVDDLRLAAAAA
jgi:uracil-DNA glycosylase